MGDTFNDLHRNGQRLNLLDLAITAAISATTTSPITTLAGAKYLAVEANFAYGSGGTNATVYVQTSLDGGSNWIDIMSFQFTTSDARKVSAVVASTALAAGATPTDGTLTANTILSGLLGDRIRLKYVTTGTYADDTSLVVSAIVKG